MRHFWSLVLVAALAPAGAGADIVRSMNPERIREAIQWGLTASDAELGQFDAHTENTWLVNFDTPFLRVAQLAHTMKLQNLPVSDTDISPKLTDDAVHLYVHARLDLGEAKESLPNIEYVILTRPGRSDGPVVIVQPTSLQSFVRRVPVADDYDGPTRIAKSVKATFPLSAFGPDSQIRVTFQDGRVRTVKLDPQLFSHLR